MPATQYHDTDTVDKPWSGSAAEKAMPNDAGAAMFNQMYAWRDPNGDPDTKAAYKLPHHEMSDGKVGPANVNGVRAALAAVGGARGGMNMPDQDVGPVRSHLTKHLNKHRANNSSSDLFETGLMVRTWGATWAVRHHLIAQLQREHGRVIAGELVEMAATRPRDRFQATGPVAVLPLKGLITPRGSLISLLFGGEPGGLLGFRDRLDAAANDSDVKAILLDIDSEGGLVDLVPETADAIYEAREAKPIVAIANTLAASAAYWLASQAHEVVTTNSGELGSIGVYQLHEDLSGKLENEGVKVSVISAGRYKTEGNPFTPLDDDARAAAQATVNDYYGQFTADVARGRGVSQQDVTDGYGQGRVVTSKRAVSAGLADRVATFDQTYSRLAGGRARVRQSGNGNADDMHVVRAADFAYSELEKDRLLSVLAGLRCQPKGGPA